MKRFAVIIVVLAVGIAASVALAANRVSRGSGRALDNVASVNFDTGASLTDFFSGAVTAYGTGDYVPRLVLWTGGGPICRVFVGSVDPSVGTGVDANPCSIYLRAVPPDNTAAEMWFKTGNTTTAWQKIGG